MITEQKTTVEMIVTRGQESWNYLYIALGFALAIESTIVPMIAPLTWPWNLIAYVLLAVLTIWLFLFNGWFQNKLIGLKAAYEARGWRR